VDSYGLVFDTTRNEDNDDRFSGACVPYHCCLGDHVLFNGLQMDLFTMAIPSLLHNGILRPLNREHDPRHHLSNEFWQRISPLLAG